MPDPTSFTRRHFVAGVAAAAGSIPAEAAPAEPIANILHRSFIWSAASAPGHNRFSAFRQMVEIPSGADEAMLHLFADTRYVAWFNGHYLGSGPARFDPRYPEYDSLPLAAYLRRGRNVLAVLVQTLGAGNGWTMAHAPGLTFAVEWRGPGGAVRRSSGGQTRCLELDAWDHRAPVGWPYAAEWLDAGRLPAGWTEVEFDDSTWSPATPIARPTWGRFEPRSIPRLTERPIASRGVVWLDQDTAKPPGWFWHDEGTTAPNVIDERAASGPRYFRWRFELPRKPESAELRLAAGGNYVLSVNGREVANKKVLAEPQGLIQFSDADRWRTAARHVERFPIAGLEPGPNVIALEVRHRLYETQGRSPAGIAAQLVVDGESPAGLWHSHTTNPSGWNSPEFDDASWRPVTAFGPYGPTEPWLLRLGPFPFRIPRALPPPRTWPLPLKAGRRAIVDFGSVHLARPEIEMTAEPGAELEMIYSEQWTAGVEPPVSFAPDRYRALAGRQLWSPTDTRGFRYVVLSVTRGEATVSRVAATERTYPADRLGRFTCSDPLLTALWPKCVETLRQCREDAYIDTPWRERAQWLADAVACGFHAGLAAFGDTALFRRLLRQIGESQDQAGALASDSWDLLTMDQAERMPRKNLEPGWLWAHYPSDRNDIHRYLEDYMLIWVLGIAAYTAQTADLAFLRSQWARIDRLLSWFHNHRTERGLVRAREFIYFGNPVAYRTGEGACINLLYLMCLRAMADLGARIAAQTSSAGYAARAAAVETALRRHLLDTSTSLVSAMLEDGKRHEPSVHANLFALLAGLTLPPGEAAVLAWLQEHIASSQEILSPYLHYWMFEAFYHAGGPRTEQWVLDRIRQKWGPMVKAGAPTVSEFFASGDSTESSGVSGSLCHIAGTTPAWTLSSGVLGVRVLDNRGVRQIRIHPRLGDLEWAEGRVPTTLGMVTLNHHRKEGRWRSDVTLPDKATGAIGLPETLRRESIRLNGRPAIPAPERGALWLPLSPGFSTIEGEIA